MKVLAVERAWSEWTLSPEAVEAYELPMPTSLPVSMATDSALVRKGTPLFIPDFARGWELHVEFYLTVTHLGKSIPARFAHRYFDGIGLCARLLPPPHLMPLPHLDALTSNFDGAICPGMMVIPVESFGQAESGQATIRISTSAGQELSIPSGALHAADTVSFISRYMTLKTGDMIILCDTTLTTPVQPGLTFGADINGVPALNIRMK